MELWQTIPRRGRRRRQGKNYDRYLPTRATILTICLTSTLIFWIQRETSPPSTNDSSPRTIESQVITTPPRTPISNQPIPDLMITPKPTPKTHPQKKDLRRGEEGERKTRKTRLPSKKTVAPKTESNSHSEFEAKVAGLINEYRIHNGLEPLSTNDDSLKGITREKSRRIKQHGMEHGMPGIGDSKEMLRKTGKRNRESAENLAEGHPTPEEVVEGWKNSPPHNANMLNPNVKEMNIGRSEENTTAVFHN
ncbi:CAP domain-containing protein [Pasteuria penetrans]|uniref:CAP domain-containing protein n=1 Tax=Pasteuria penetrans TaxID=86005 RepID=UPI000FBFD2D9|nr:CAP domain-containing protein [Pasteuria penetrans]